MLCTLSGALLFSALGFLGDESRKAPAERYQSLIQELDTAMKAYIKEARSPRADRATLNDLDKARSPQRFIERFRDLARRSPEDPAAIDALVWISDNGNGRASEEARATLASDYLASARLLPVFRCLEHESGSRGAEALLRLAASQSPHRGVRGRACYWLARYLVEQAWYVRALQMPAGYWIGRTQVDIEPSRHIEAAYGKEALDRLTKMDAAKIMVEALATYRTVLSAYPDVVNDTRMRGHTKTLGEAAGTELRALENLAIGRTVPETVGQDVDAKPFRLSDYRGKVVVLDFGSHTYCSSCRDLIPHWRALTKRLEGKPFALIGINADPDLTKLRKALEASEVTWRTVWDGDLGGPIFRSWDIKGWPTIFVIDRQGVIRYKDVFGKELDEAIDVLLAN